VYSRRATSGLRPIGMSDRRFMAATPVLVEGFEQCSAPASSPLGQATLIQVNSPASPIVSQMMAYRRSTHRDFLQNSASKLQRAKFSEQNSARLRAAHDCSRAELALALLT
jgi:hypothetical protein